MKIKEKFALNFANTDIANGVVLGLTAYSAYVTGRHEGYHAGFNKCKEMAIKLANEFPDSGLLAVLETLGDKEV